MANGVTIRELSEESGLPVRRIRYYVDQGILPPPEGRGRGARYSPKCVTLLIALKGLKEKNHSLESIRHLISHPDSKFWDRVDRRLGKKLEGVAVAWNPKTNPPSLPEPETSHTYQLVPGVEIVFREKFHKAHLGKVSEILALVKGVINRRK